MAFSATMVWEVRSTGSDANGGGFDPVSGVPGTDFSVADSPAVTHTDLVIDGTLDTKATSAANPFTSAHVGNVVNVTGGTGFTVQRAQVMSVASGAATFDKSLGTLGSTGGVGNLGGAFASPGQAAAVRVASNTIFIRNSGGASPSVYVLSSSSNVSGGRVSEGVTGSTAAPMCWVGYETTRTVTNTDPNRPILKANANGMTCFTASHNQAVIRNLDAGNNGAFTGCTGFSLSFNWERIERCVARDLATGFLLSAATTKAVQVAAIDCTQGINTGGSAVYGFALVGCTTGINCGTGGAIAEDGLILPGAGYGLTVGGENVTVRRVTVAGRTGATGNGVVVNGNLSNVLVEDVISYGNAQRNWSFGVPSADHRMLRCASGDGGVADSIPANVADGLIALTANPFADTAAGDYSLNDAAGGGALLKAASRTFIGLSTTTDRGDVGPVQSAPAGGGDTYVFNIEG